MMQQYSILLGCDQLYYNNWSIELLKSIHYHNPWIKLRCHVVNPVNLIKLDFVTYTTEDINFANDTSKISYLQSARFIAASKISMSESFITLDCDTICTRSFTQDDFAELFDNPYVMQHHKQDRWLVGMGT
jgi:lipopolysaccharide biosynthesis glycosyltransferase